jgi:hypothetical protein
VRDLWLRLGLGLLAAAAANVGVWALAAPRSFYDDFPGGGRSWVSAVGPYNEHLVRDVGELNLALALLLAAAAVLLGRRLVIVALAVYLVNAVPHFIFHVSHMDELSTGDQVAQTVSLALAVLLPLALLPLAWRSRPRA